MRCRMIRGMRVMPRRIVFFTIGHNRCIGKHPIGFVETMFTWNAKIVCRERDSFFFSLSLVICSWLGVGEQIPRRVAQTQSHRALRNDFAIWPGKEHKSTATEVLTVHRNSWFMLVEETWWKWISIGRFLIQLNVQFSISTYTSKINWAQHSFRISDTGN